jgi:hypothetical protein
VIVHGEADTWEAAVQVVVRLGAPVIRDEVSPFCHPLDAYVNVGRAAPYTFVAAFAVIVSVALLTTCDRTEEVDPA